MKRIRKRVLHSPRRRRCDIAHAKCQLQINFLFPIFTTLFNDSGHFFFFSSIIIMGVNVNCLSYNRWLNEWTHIGTLWVFLLLCAVAAIETINLLISCFLYIFSRNLTKELFELLFHFLVPLSCPNETLTDVKCLTVTGQQHQQANKWRGVIWTSFIVVFV